MSNQQIRRISFTDKEIESLINGEVVERKLEDGSIIKMRQSYFKDIAASIIERDKKIFSKSEISNIKSQCNSMGVK